MSVRLECGDCLEIMPKLRADGLRAHAVVCDPPYHLASIVDRLGNPDAAPIQSGVTGVYARSSSGFMGQKWDGGDVAFRVETWRKVFDMMHPGAHLVAFSHSRTYHRMACAIEDAGFEIRNMLDWMYGTGFPKSHNLDGEWDGWGTDLKPAKEPIVLARKPIIGSVAENMAMFGTGALNIDACRIPALDEGYARNCPGDRGHADNRKRDMDFALTAGSASSIGRWPTNVLHDGSDEVLAAFPQSAGAIAPVQPSSGRKTNMVYGKFNANNASEPRHDTGSAARFHYSTKAVDGERVYRCTTCGAHQLGKPKCGHDTLEAHPTVKPIGTMRWLCRLVTPPGGLILDPFAGTGTTGAAAIAEGFEAVLIEQDADYQADIRVRLGGAVTGIVAPRAVRQLDAGPLFG